MRLVMLGSFLRSVSRVVRARHIGARFAVLALALTAIPAGAGVAAASSGQAARGAGVTASHPKPFDVSTASLNNMRTSWDPSEPNLSPSTVKGSSFGQLVRTSVTGLVYAEPLVIGSTVIVATESNYVYALNASTGAVEWKTGVGPAYKIPNCQVVLWLDDAPSTAAQRAAFQNYMEHGGAWLGFHIAGWMDSRATWPWFADFLGTMF